MSSTLQERWMSNGAGISIYCSGAQTFTVTTTHLMDELRLRVAKGATTPQTNVNIDLYSCNGSHEPDTLIENIGAIDTDTLTTSLGTKYFYPSILLTSGIEYALVFTITGDSICQTGDAGVDNNIRIGGGSGYSNGYGWHKQCALNGSWACSLTWSNPALDFDFREYGAALPGKPTNPSPEHEETNITLDESPLSWNASNPAANTYEIYFREKGEIWGDPIGIAQAGVSYVLDFGYINYEKTYEWRVDATNAAGTIAGDTWDFNSIVFDPPVSGASGENNMVTLRRLVVAVENKIWYEDI